MHTTAGVLLKAIAGLSSIKTIVEIGTLDGTGSTTSILTGIECRSEGDFIEFISVEANATAHKLANANLHNYKHLKLIYGSLLDQNSPITVFGLNEVEEKWLKGDIESRFAAPNVIEMIPNQIDLLLLDGGEFTSLNDYLVLRGRVKILVLDDVGTRKNRLVNILAKQDGYVEIFDDGKFAILAHFQRSADLSLELLCTISQTLQYRLLAS